MTRPRALFHMPTGGPYMLSHSVGALPRASKARFAADVLEPWASLGSDGWPLWLEAVDRFRAAIAGVIGGEALEVCPQPSVSAGLTSLLSGLRRESGRDVLLASAHTFPSIGFAMKQFERFGYRLDLIPEDRDPGDFATWAERIDGRVAAVVPMHVHSNTGVVSPVAEIARATRAAGAICIVDLCQSTGILPVDVRALGVDAAVGSCVKWLCGGSGAGYLWVRADLIADIDPVNVGWFSHEAPFEFDIRDFHYAPDARRFWGGTPTIAPYVLATSGIETLASIGEGAVLAQNRAIIAAIATAADVELDMTNRGGTLCLRARDLKAVIEVLKSIDCRFDQRGETVRLSPHVFNTRVEGRRIGLALRGHGLTLTAPAVPGA